jgi:hypothetical protein
MVVALTTVVWIGRETRPRPGEAWMFRLSVLSGYHGLKAIKRPGGLQETGWMTNSISSIRKLVSDSESAKVATVPTVRSQLRTIALAIERNASQILDQQYVVPEKSERLPAD